MTCTIPYIDNSTLEDSEKESAKQNHIDILKTILAETSLHLKPLSRTRKVDGKTIKYISIPEKYVKRDEDLIKSLLKLEDKDKVNIIKLSNDNYAISIDVLREGINIESLGLFDQEHEYLQNLKDTNPEKILDRQEDLVSIISDEESRKTLYKILANVKESIISMLEDSKVKESTLGRELEFLMSGFDDESNLYKLDTAMSFIRSAVYFTNIYTKKFKGKNSYLNKLKKINDNPNYEQRKQERGALAYQVDFIKNKFYVFGKLQEVVDQLKLNSTEINDVFETYNRHAILNKLEALGKSEINSNLDKFEVILAENYNSIHDLSDEIMSLSDNVKSDLTFEELKDIFNDSIFKSLLDENGKPQKTLLQQVIQTKDALTDIQREVKNFMIESQVDTLYDSYLAFILEVDSEKEIPNSPKVKSVFQQAHLISKDQIREDIFKANGSIGYWSHMLKRGVDMPDNFMFLTAKLLESSTMEADAEKFMKLQEVNNSFSDFTDEIEDYSEAIKTYTFDVPNFNKPEKFEHIKGVNGAKDSIIHTYYRKNKQGLPEEIKEPYELPDNPVYGRYYKLTSKHDDLWAYRDDSGDYYKVYATKAIKGKNLNHRYAIESSIHQSKVNYYLEGIKKGEILGIYGKGISSKNGKSYLKTDLQLKGEINAAFYSQFSTPIEKIEKGSDLKLTNKVIQQIQQADTYEEKVKIKTKNFRNKYLDTNKDQLIKDIQDGGSKLITYGLQLFVQLANDEYVLVDADVVNDKLVLKLNGKNITEDVKSYFVKGNSYYVYSKDEVLDDTKFNNKLKDNKFKRFYDLYSKEYDKIAEKDHTGFMTNGKIGQIFFKEKQTYKQLLEELKANPGQAIKNKFNRFFTTETTEMMELVNSKGEYIDKNNIPLKPGEKPIKVPKTKINPDGLELNQFRPAFTNRANNQDYVSSDVMINLLGMIDQSISYDKIYDIEPQMRFAMLLNQGSEELGLASRKVSETVKGKRFANSRNKNTEEHIKTLNFIIKSGAYDDPVITNSLGKGSALEKVVNIIRPLTFFQQMAGNIYSSVNNLIVGQINNYIQASSKKFNLNSKHVLDSYKEIGKNIMGVMSGTVGNTNISDSNYIVKLAHMFNAISGLAVDSKNFIEKVDAVDHFLSYKTFFLGQSGGEVLNQLPLMLGFMKSYELTLATNTTPAYTMYDAIRINGKAITDTSETEGILSLVDSNNVPLSSRQISLFAAKLTTINSEAQGDYNKTQRVRGRYEFLFSLGMTFGGWIYPNMRKRFRYDMKYDHMAGAEDFGGHQMNFILNTFGSLGEYKELFAFGAEESPTDFLQRQSLPILKKLGLGTVKTFGTLPLNVLNALTGFKGYEAEQKSLHKFLSFKDKDSQEFKDFYNLKQLPNEPNSEFQSRVEEAHDFYVTALKTASIEYTIMTAIIIIGLMLSTLADDDDDDPTLKGRMAKMLEVQSRQLVTDMSLGAPLLSPLKPVDFFSQRSKDPLVILRTIDINLKVIKNILGFQVNLEQGEYNFNIDDKYSKSGPGYNKGQLKLSKSLERAFGPIYQFNRIFNPEQQANIIKLMNQGAILTDKDLADKEEEL